MSFYRKKPVVIEAREFSQYVGRNAYALSNWINNNKGEALVNNETGRLHIKTLESTTENWFECTDGDFIIKGVQGEFYACKPDIFHQTYEKVDDHE